MLTHSKWIDYNDSSGSDGGIALRSVVKLCSRSSSRNSSSHAVSAVSLARDKKRIGALITAITYQFRGNTYTIRFRCLVICGQYSREDIFVPV